MVWTLDPHRLYPPKGFGQGLLTAEIWPFKFFSPIFSFFVENLIFEAETHLMMPKDTRIGIDVENWNFFRNKKFYYMGIENTYRSLSKISCAYFKLT